MVMSLFSLLTYLDGLNDRNPPVNDLSLPFFFGGFPFLKTVILRHALYKCRVILLDIIIYLLKVYNLS